MVVAVSAVIFVLVISIDLFACAFAYGTAGVKVSFGKILLINAIGKLIVGSGLFIGYFVGGFMPEGVGIWVGFAVLLSVGVIKLIQWLVTRGKANKAIARNITWGEAAALGIVLALDGLAAGIGTTMTLLSLLFIFSVFAISVLSDQFVFMASQRLGKSLTKKANLDLGWLSGVVLMIVSVCKLFFELFTL